MNNELELSQETNPFLIEAQQKYQGNKRNHSKKNIRTILIRMRIRSKLPDDEEYVNKKDWVYLKKYLRFNEICFNDLTEICKFSEILDVIYGKLRIEKFKPDKNITPNTIVIKRDNKHKTIKRDDKYNNTSKKRIKKIIYTDEERMVSQSIYNNGVNWFDKLKADASITQNTIIIKRGDEYNTINNVKIDNDITNNAINDEFLIQQTKVEPTHKTITPNTELINKKNEELEEMLSNLGSKPKIYIERKDNINLRKIGIIYEIHIQKALINLGYIVKLTPLTHDYGVDLIVYKSDVIITIQCKYWAELVGVSAVQEVYAGRDFYKANKALVVSNNLFTRNAEILANKIGVHLLTIKLNDNNISSLLSII